MFRTWILIISLLLSLVFYLRTSSSTKTEDSPLLYSKRIVAFADIHGDANHLTRILRNAGVIDENRDWIGGSTTLVSTGDLVDRGKDTIILYQLMDKLRGQASAVGGKVVSLLGNHEYMNLLSDLRYVTDEDIESFGGKEERAEAFAAGGWIAETFRSNYSINARIEYFDQNQITDSALSKELLKLAKTGVFESSGAHFTHAGILPTYPPVVNSKPPSAVDIVNEIGHSFLTQILNKQPATPTHQQFYGRDGPMWARNFALEEDEKICLLAFKTTKMLGVRRLFMGHTPHFESIVTRCDESILLIDTGISSAYGGVLSSINILYTLEKIPKSKKWKEIELITALYVETGNNVELTRNERILQL